MRSARLLAETAVSSVLRRPLDVAAGAVLSATALGVVINALYLQPGPHPAPFFAVRPAAVAATAPGAKPRVVDAAKPVAAPRARPDIVADVQRELQRRGFYDGQVDGVVGSKTDAALRDFEQQAGLKPTGEPTEELLRQLGQSNLKAPPAAPAVRRDPLGDLIAPPSKRVVAVQRALSDFGYAQLKPTGTVGPDTRAAIERFERERRLPVTGTVTDRLMRELAAMTGRPLE